MPITYEDIEHKLQPPLDCAKEGDLRGREFHNRLIVNYENVDFAGCVLYHCFPTVFQGAIELNPAESKKDVTLDGADLRGANLKFGKLEGTHLYRANLRDADLGGANLYGANLERANLQGAYLEGADLQGANLRNAHLEGANLQGAEYDSNTNV